MNGMNVDRVVCIVDIPVALETEWVNGLMSVASLSPAPVLCARAASKCSGY